MYKQGSELLLDFMDMLMQNEGTVYKSIKNNQLDR